MHLIFSNPAETSIQATLEADDTLGNLTGPGTCFVPVDEANAEYADIVEHDYPIDPYVPPPETKPTPDANLRLDAGVEAAVNYFNSTPIPEGLASENSLEARVDRLEATVKAMLEGQMSHLEAA